MFLFYLMQTVLITGANGFVGHYLVQQFLSKNYTVIATGRDPGRLKIKDDRFRFYSFDYTDKKEVEQLFTEVKPAVVIHSGAISSPDECEQNKTGAFLNNVTGTINLLQEAARYKAHFIFLSTDFVFNGKQGFYKEDDEKDPVNYYGETKHLAEEQVRQYAHAWTIIRTVLVYGKAFTGKGNFVTTTVNSLRQKKPLTIFNDQLRTPTFVEDLALAIATIVDKSAKGIFHIAGDEAFTLYGLALEIANQFDLDKSLIIPIKEGDIPLAAKRPKKTGLDCSRAKNELDFEPTSLKDALKKTVEM